MRPENPPTIWRIFISITLMFAFSVQAFAGAFPCHSNHSSHSSTPHQMMMSHSSHDGHTMSMHHQWESETTMNHDNAECCQHPCGHSAADCMCDVAMSSLLLDVQTQLTEDLFLANVVASFNDAVPIQAPNVLFRPPKL